MSAPSNSDYELLTEHFGYPPVALIDDIINTVNVLADRALDSVESLLLSIPPHKLGFVRAKSCHAGKAKESANVDDDDAAAAARREVESGTHQLETLLNASIDKNFDLFELYTMRNILTVRPQDRPYMRLAHYEGLDFSGPSTVESAHHPDRPTVESVTALRRRVQASQKLHNALEAERLRNDALLRELRALLGESVQDPSSAGAHAPAVPEAGGETESSPAPADVEPQPGLFAFLRNKGNLPESGSEQPVTTAAEFALSQLQALRSLSASLRTVLPDLGTSADNDGSGSNDDETDAAPWVSKAGGNKQASSSRGGSLRRQRAQYIDSSSRTYLERVRGLELGPHGEVRDGEWQGEGRSLARDEVEGLESVAATLGHARRDHVQDSHDSPARGASEDG